MHWFRRGVGTTIGTILLVVETIRILSELGFIKAASGALNIWNIYEFLRDHVWNAGWAGTMLDVLSHPLVHVLLLGSGVALIIWDNRRSKPIPSAQPSGPPAEVTASEPPPPPPAPRALSTYEADLKVKAIDNVLEILTMDMEPIIAIWPRLTNWFNAIKDPTYNPNFRQELMAFRESFKGAALKLDNLRDRLPQYQDVIVAAQQTRYNEFIAAIERYMGVFMHIQDSVKPNAPDEALRTFLDKPAMEFDRAMTGFIGWRNAARSQVIELRRAISP
jgi:hypothetical protein